MKIGKLLLLVALSPMLSGQPTPRQPQPRLQGQDTKTPSGLYQRPQPNSSKQERDDLFYFSTKLVNRNDVDYGSWIEQRRRTLVEASVTNPFFWYSALTTTFVMVLMLMYGVRVLDERRKLWRAAELLTDIWNQELHSRAVAFAAVEKYNDHMAECNRVVETQMSGRPSAAAMESKDANDRLDIASAQRDALDSENRRLKAELQKKDAMLGEMSSRLDVLERRTETNGSAAAPAGDAEATRRLIARVNELQQQLQAEQRKNRQLKGA